jgi:hypothetical protein
MFGHKGERIMTCGRLWLSVTVAALLASSLGIAADALQIRVLSGRPDMVTGGDALLAISGGTARPIVVTLNGRDISAAFREGPATGRRLGTVEGLQLGKDIVRVKAEGQRARIELLNYPVIGPVFSGPHQAPFVCQTEDAGLGPPLDANCSAETLVEYFYKSTEPPSEEEQSSPRPSIPRGFKVLDPSAPRPPDLAQTTTTQGKTVDFIVRRETGTINRAIYRIAFLHKPGEPLPDPWTANEAWNGRLVYSFGGGCRAGYRQGRVSGGMNEALLSAGYALAASSLNVFGNNCNDVISAETMMMVKEYFIESFGVPVHTIGTGGSGGSMQQHLIAQNYPGLLDGIIPASSYPDIITLIPPVTDCSLLARAFEESRFPWSEAEKRAVSGFATWRTCESWMRSFSPGLISATHCVSTIPPDQVYDPEARPDGVRCGIHDNQVNLYGRDPSTGLPRRTLDNVGVQYGLVAFNAGQISAEQFLELNESIGGYDADSNIVPERSTADRTALRIAYRTGRVNSGGGDLGVIPIIDARRYRDTDGDIHDRVRSFLMTARLERNNGRADNRVVLTHGAGANAADAVRFIDRWLDNITEDGSAGSGPEKIARNKPPELSDACWTAEGEKIPEPASLDGAGRCNELYAAHRDPRIVAGAPPANDVLKCQLKPIDPKDYQQTLTDGQLAGLKKIFPKGVCDYSRPGVEQTTIAGTWLTY